jgi:hypothetical protein
MPVRNEEWMGLNNFVWFFGTVEDIHDPLNIGRVRVRCHGWHSDDPSDLNAKDLPWAQVMMPATSASTSGIGISPTGLVVGSQVVGFFLDGNRAQMPMILGSFHGIPSEASRFLYPTEDQVGYPDTPKLAYDRWTNDSITETKKDNRVEDIPTASRYKVSVSHDKPEPDYSQVSWNEPDQRGGESQYPYNNVTQTRSGHAFEVDDTPGGERIHQYHTKGSFYEIQPDGSRITKIVGNDYEITVNDKNVLIQGACNVTVANDCRLYFVSDLIQEVRGDYHLTVWGDTITKVMGNESKEILGSVSHQINGNESRRITGNQDITVIQNSTNIVNGNYKLSVSKDSNFVTLKSMKQIATDIAIATGNTLKVKSAGDATFTYNSNHNITYNSNYNVNYNGDTLTRRKPNGTDKTCSTDTPRISINDCSSVPSL